MKINEVATYLDLPSETLRYWEKVGIIPKAKRDDSGYRQFDQKDVDWIRYVKCIREIGIPIAQIKEYTDAARTNGDVILRKEILVAQRSKLQARIKEIELAIQMVDYKIDNYTSMSFSSKLHQDDDSDE
jgi:DNA-binding transcriptional MerR regulator